jgi:multisubunit Na+/H+ antiporter MnhB subunit
MEGTPQTPPPPTPAAAPAKPEQGNGLVIAGVITAIIIPIIGLVIGIVLVNKGRRNPGLGVIALAIVAGVVNYLLLYS